VAYTDVWDVTAPLNTQLANLGAADFRATKLDIMQRVASFGAGLLAARPTPETTSGTADWTGVMYWATDTKQAFRWSGTAWVDISANIPGGGGSSSALATFGGVTSAPSDTTLDTIYDYTLPANTLGATGGFKVTFFFDAAITTNTDVTVVFGGTSFLLGHFTTGGTRRIEFTVINKTTSTQGVEYVILLSSGATVVSSNGSAAVDTTADQHISVKCQKTTAGDVTNFNNGVIARL
jgi:hypothetical protein